LNHDETLRLILQVIIAEHGLWETGRRKNAMNGPDEAELHLTRVYPQVTG
jgi:hypothetical protein